jgi:hypothetical protein
MLLLMWLCLAAQMLMLMLVGLLLRGWRSLPYIGWLVAPVVRDFAVCSRHNSLVTSVKLL